MNYKYIKIINDEQPFKKLIFEFGEVADIKYDRDDLIEFLNYFSRNLIKSDINRLEGVTFLANWLRKSNIKKLLETNIGEKIIGDGRKKIFPLPRGIICHWIAGNVPSLALFSSIQGLLVGNKNLIRIPEQSIKFVDSIFDVFAKTETYKINGAELMEEYFRIFHISSSNKKLNKIMSSTADMRVIWGGAEAVDQIRKYPVMSHCEDAIFGPKYSFGLIAEDMIHSEKIVSIIKKIINDISFVEQSGCSSPHTIFIEGEIDNIAKLFSEEFTKSLKKFPKNNIDEGTAIHIINKRAEYAMENKLLMMPTENSWTILGGGEIVLEDPIQYRTVFLKKINNISEIYPLITKEVQSIGLATENIAKAIEFTKKVGIRGVARVVAPGQMNNYDSPWDGILLMSRMVRWVRLSLM